MPPCSPAKGKLGFYLAFCEDFEKADWQRVAANTVRLGLNEEKVSHLYLSATAWVNQQFQAMEAQPVHPARNDNVLLKGRCHFINLQQSHPRIQPARWRWPLPPLPGMHRLATLV